jgi:hypothetical protein
MAETRRKFGRWRFVGLPQRLFRLAGETSLTQVPAGRASVALLSLAH